MARWTASRGVWLAVVALSLLGVETAPAWGQAVASAPSDPAALARTGIVAGSEYTPGLPSIVIVPGDDPDPANFTNLVNELKKNFNVFFYIYKKEMIGPNTGAGFRTELETFIGQQKTVEDASNQFDDAIRELVRQTGETSLAILAHSMGGLVARDAMTSDRPSMNTLARGGPNALKIILFTVATPFQGIGGVHAPVGGRLAAEIGAAFADIGSVYYEPMSDRDYPFLRGATGSNVTHYKIVSLEDMEIDYVVTESGQELPDPAWEPPADQIVRRRAGHNGILTYTDNAHWLANFIKEKTQPPETVRRVSMNTMRSGFGIGGSYSRDSVTDMLASAATETRTVTFGGTTTTTTTVRDVAALNRDFDYGWRLDVASADASVSLWPGASIVIPWADGAIGRGTARFSNTNTTQADDADRFESSGLFGAVGAGIQVMPFRNGFAIAAGYRYERLADLDVTREPALTAPGATVTESNHLAYHAHTVHAHIGYESRRVRVLAGVRQSRRRVRLSGSARADFSQTAGSTAVQTLDFAYDFKDDAVQPMAQVGVRVANSPVVVHADASGRSGRYSVRVGLLYNPVQ